jgi:hypothetical protein
MLSIQRILKNNYRIAETVSAAFCYPRFGMMIHHTDSTCEFAYDLKSHIGQINKGLDSAATFKWTIVDLKKDWKKVFSFKKEKIIVVRLKSGLN